VEFQKGYAAMSLTFLQVAAALNAFYAADPTILRNFGKKLLGDDKLEFLLQDLVEKGNIPSLKSIGKNAKLPDLLPKVIEEIKAIPQIANGFGVLGLDERSSLVKNTRCAILHLTPAEMQPSAISDADLVKHGILWHVISLPQVTDMPLFAKRLQVIRTAFIKWAEVCRVVPQETPIREQANLLISCEDLTGTFSDAIALTSFGPPGKRQMTMRYNRKTVWDKNKFLSTTIHEIGHALGLDDRKSPGEIMNDTYQPGLETIGKTDKSIAIGIWGARA